MSTLLTQHSKALFRQLAAIPGSSGVKTIIENHDAWVHRDQVDEEITAAIRFAATHQPRPAEVTARIEHNRRSLSSLVTKLPTHLSIAG